MHNSKGYKKKKPSDPSKKSSRTKDRSPKGVIPLSARSSGTKSVSFSLPPSFSHCFSLTFPPPHPPTTTTPPSSLCHNCAGRTSVCPGTHQSSRRCLSSPKSRCFTFFSPAASLSLPTSRHLPISSMDSTVGWAQVGGGDGGRPTRMLFTLCLQANTIFPLEEKRIPHVHT